VTFRLLFVFVVLAHQQRRVIHFKVTAHPTSELTARQFGEAFLWDSAPRYLLHDRDSIYDGRFHDQVREIRVREVLTAPRSPWQSPYVERLIGSIRRECVDHVIVFNEASLRRTLRSYLRSYGSSRTHLSLGIDAPEGRTVQSSEIGPMVEWADCTIATNAAPPQGADFNCAAVLKTHAEVARELAPFASVFTAISLTHVPIVASNPSKNGDPRLLDGSME
jgi:Integrase core domain